MAQFLLTEFLGLSTLGSIISCIFHQFWKFLRPSCCKFSENSPNIWYFDGFEGSYGRKTKNVENQKICQFEKILKLSLFWGWHFSIFFSFLLLKNTNKWAPTLNGQNSWKHQDTAKNTLIYSPLTESSLTERHCIISYYLLLLNRNTIYK